MPLSAGTKLGSYEIVGPIGEGGMGEVYRARDPRLDRDVAIKILPADLAVDADRVRRFEQEARALGQLNHPNVLATYDVGQIPPGLPGAGAPFLVSELLDGQTLREELSARTLPLRTVLAHARDIAEGLAAAHDKGLVHRDLKPANLFVTRDGRIKILDFGLAKATGRAPDGASTKIASPATELGVVLGTVGYMAPEQVRAQAVDHRADIFAFGCVLYEMLTGRRAFQADTAADTMSAILTSDPAATRRPGPDPDVPAGLERIVRRCLEKSPERRFQSARDLAFSLESGAQSGVESATGASSSGATSPTAPARMKSRAPSRAAIAAIAAIAIVGLAALGWMTYPWSSSREESAPTPLANVTPFLVSEAVESQPAWSPAGNFIAFASTAAGNDDVWMVDLSGANPINLTKEYSGRDSFPAWSPDGTRIAFYSDRDGGGIYTMTPLGSDVRRVAAVLPSAFYTFSLQWAHDGSLVYTNFDEAGVKQVYSTPAPLTGGAAPSCLTCAAKVAGARDAELSPSGRLLAYVGGLQGARPPLYVMHLESGNVHVIADRTDAPHWQADDRLLFLSTRDGLADVWEVRVDPRTGVRNADPVRVTSGLDAIAFAVSADGRQMLAVKEKSTSTLWTFPTSAAAIDSTTSGTELTTSSARDGRPRWSTDGREIYFESNRRGSLDVWKVAASGGAPVRVTSSTAPESRPRPSPDGKWLAFDTDGNWLWIARSDGSGAQEASDWKAKYTNVCCSAWSPHELRLAFSTVGLDGQGRLTFADLDQATGRVKNIREVDVPGALEEYPRWSPDGRSIAYEAFSDGSWNLWLANADLTAPVQITNHPGNERQAAWQSEPRLLYYMTDTEEVWRMAIGGEPKRWLAIRGLRVGADSLDISPDGRRLAVSLQKPESDLWLVGR